eukprot:COSAG06_NODE_54888_length_292_cov_0.906736_1_plen_28_part_10
MQQALAILARVKHVQIRAEAMQHLDTLH